MATGNDVLLTGIQLAGSEVIDISLSEDAYGWCRCGNFQNMPSSVLYSASSCRRVSSRHGNKCSYRADSILHTPELIYTGSRDSVTPLRCTSAFRILITPLISSNGHSCGVVSILEKIPTYHFVVLKCLLLLQETELAGINLLRSVFIRLLLDPFGSK